MIIRPLDMADMNLVEIKKDNQRRIPHCKLHGAMNKISEFGYWRCISTYRIEGDRLIENACRAGCIMEKV